MLSQYGSFRQQLAPQDWGVAVLSGGNLTAQADALEFFIQAHNRVGVNKLSAGKSVTVTANSKIRITINSSAIASGEDTFKFVISARYRAETPKQLAEIYVRESDQYTFKSLPITLDFVKPAHISTDLIQPLSTGDDRIHGQIRLVSGTAYRYDSTATTGLVQSTPGYWVEDTRGGSVVVTNTRGQYGADQKTSTATLVIPARLSDEGDITTEPIVFWWSNNLESNIGNFSPAGSALNLKIYLNGSLANSDNIPYGNLFSNLITIRLLGYVDIATGILNTALSGVNVFKQWTPTASGMTLPANLDPGFAAAYSISVEFSGDSLATILETGGTIGIELTKEPTPGVYEPSTGVLGDSVLEGLYVLPNKMIAGVATLNNYRVTYRTISYFVGLQADTAAQKVAINNSPSGLARVRQGDLANGEYLRAIVGTVSGTQTISSFSDVQATIPNQSIKLTINYPVNTETGLGTIRGNYPDIIAGNNQAAFNVPQLIIYLHNTSQNIYYRLSPVPVVPGASQEITISNLNNATQINFADLPSSSNSFGLFGYLTSNVTTSSVVGNFPFNLYRVAIAYHYPANNLALTSISHATSYGALPQVRGSLVDSLENNLYWLTPAATLAIARAISQEKLIHGAVLLVITTETLYRYDSNSNATDDGVLVIRPTANTGLGRFLALASKTGSSGLEDLDWNPFAKGELITWTGSEVTLLARGQNGFYLKSDNNSPSGLAWAEITSEGSTLPSLGGENKVLYSNNNEVAEWKRMWSKSGAAASASPNVLVYANAKEEATDGLMPNFFNIIPSPTGTTKSTLIFDPVAESYSWLNFTMAGLLDTYSVGTTVPHNSQLIYDAATSKWVPGIGKVDATITSLTDTFIDSPANNYPLIWDTLTGKFIVGMPELSAINGLKYTTSSVSVPGDTLWANTKVLVSARNPGRDLRKTLDSIAVINASLSTSSPYSAGTTSYGFNKTSRQSIQIATNSDTLLASNPFSLELFFKPTELTSGRQYVLAERNNGVEVEFGLGISETTPNVFNIIFVGTAIGGNSPIILTSNVSGGILLNNWYHVAVTRNGNDWRLFVSGTLQQTVTSSAALFSAFAYPSQVFLTLGRRNGLPANDNLQFVGNIEDFRLTLGNARYINNFTPPTIPLPITQGGSKNVKNYFISFAGLTDVDETVTPLENYVPAWSTSKNKYVPKPIGSGGEVVTLSLNQLSNVNVGSATTNNFLAKDSDGVWRGRAIGSGVTSVNGLSGSVTLTTDQIAQGTTNLFLTTGAIATQLAASNLEQLANVQTTIADNLYLRKVSGVWQGASISFPVTGINSKTGNVTLTTTDISEGTNLYYTDTRVTTRINATSIDALSDVTLTSPSSNQVLIYSGSAFVNQSLSTSAITEGTNLYYTNARVATHVNTLSISNFGGVFTGTPATGKIVSVDANGKLTFINAPSGSLVNSDGLAEGTTNLYYTDARVTTRINATSIDALNDVTLTSPSSNQVLIYSGGAFVNQSLSTSAITEGTNLYYTDARVTTRINATSIDALSDVTLTSPSSNQVLIYSGGAFVNQSLSTSAITEGTNLYYTDARVATHVNTLSISNFGGVFTGTPTTGKIVSVNASGKLTFIDAPSGGGSLTNTDGLAEGTTNLYYTDAKVTSRINATSIDALSDVSLTSPSSNQVLIYSGGAFVNQSLSTSTITEGTNLYYTNARVATHVNTLSPSNFGGVFTGTATEGTIPVVDSSGKLAFSPRFPVQLFRSVTGNHTLESSDLGKIIRISNTSTVTLPSGLADGFQVTIFNETNSVITLTSTGTIKAKALTCPNQYGAIYATHVSANTWIVVGDLA